MLPTGSTASSPQSDLIKTMQPQPQQIFIPSSGSNGTSNIRPTQQTNTIYRGPPTAVATRGAQRHVSIPPMFPQTIHQGVVMPTYPTYGPRQPAYQNPHYSYSQTMQPFYSSYQFYQPMQQSQTHQRGQVGVSPGVGVNVNVGNTLSVQATPNGPPGAAQGPMALASGAVLSVPACSNTVLGVASTGPGQQQVSVGMPTLVGVPAAPQIQPGPNKIRRRKHALEIIDPDTKRNIFEDIEPPVSNITEGENRDQITSATAAVLSSEVQPVSCTQQDVSIGLAPMVLPTDGHTIIYNMDMQQIPLQRDVSGGQTPIVSAMTDAPSVEIRPTLQKPRTKKIIPITSPKDEQSKPQSLAKTAGESPKQHQQQQQQQQRQQPQQEQQEQPAKKSEEISITKSTSVPNPCQVFRECEPERSANANNIHTALGSQLEATNIISISTKENDIDLHTSKESNLKNITADQIAVADMHSSEGGHANTTAYVTTADNQHHMDFNSNNSCDIAVSNNTDSAKILPLNSEVETKADEEATIAVDIAAEVIQSTLDDMNLNDKAEKVEIEEEEESSSVVTTPQTATSTLIESDAVAVGNDSNQKIIATITEYISDSDSAAFKNNNNNANNNVNNENKNATISKIVEQNKIDAADLANCDETDRSAVILSSKEATPHHKNDNEKMPPPPIAQTSREVPTSTARSINFSANSTKTAALSANNNPIKLSQTAKNAPLPASAATVGKAYVPLLNYNEGQWSPQNLTGKKQYDRMQLLQLRDAQASRIQPELKNISILPQPNLLPSFARGNTKRVQSSIVGPMNGNRGADSGNYASKQSSISGVSGRGSSSKGMIHVNLSLNQDVKLNETDNAWRPRVLVSDRDGGNNDPSEQTQREKEELIRSVRGILNKLTPEKFNALVEEIIKLKIDTPEKMENVLVLVFEKAVDEPNFSVSYARLCLRLINEARARDERMGSDTKSNMAHFHIALLDKTEREFIQNVSKRVAKEAKLQPILDKIKNCTDPAEKVELQTILEEEERKIRRRSGGTVRFIGELFKISMLTGKIIKQCIDVLLEPKTEDLLECLCKLLTTVGAKFEQTPLDKNSTVCFSLDQTIARMQAIASKTDNVKVSSRVRFMLQDVIDLRKNKWQSSRNDAPKTMEQIEKEAKNEQLSSLYGSILTGSAGQGSGCGGGANQSANKRDDRGSNRYDSRSGNSAYGGSHSQRGGDTGSLRRQQQSASGGGISSSGGSGNSNFGVSNNDDNTWQIQTSKGGRSLAVDTNKLEGLLNQNVDMGSKKMGGVSQFIWSTQRQSAATTTPSNSFAALSSLVDKTSDRDRDRDRDPDRDRGVSRNKGSYSKGSMERDRYNDRGIHSRTGSSQGSRENSSSRGLQGGRGSTNASTVQKSTSHKNYVQVMAPRMAGKASASISSTSSASANALHPHHREQSHPAIQRDSSQALPLPTAPPTAVFEEISAVDEQLMKSVAFDLIEATANAGSVTAAILPIIHHLKDKQRCTFIYYILTDYLHLANVGPLYRRYMANITIYMFKLKIIGVDHFRLAYEQFCEISSDLLYDVPDLWLYIFQFTVPLIQKQILTVRDLWIKQLRDSDTPKLGQKFLKSLLVCSLGEIGPNFTITMWKKCRLSWADFMPEADVNNFIKANKLEYIENEAAVPEICIKDSLDKQMARVLERIKFLLIEGSDQNAIIDYINGNITDIDKHFISSLTTVLSHFAINFKDDSYKLDTQCFKNVCIPVLQRYVDSNEERELECLYAMQSLVHTLEHPRALLSELFGELYDNDVIPQESFIKWRESKDQCRPGKGVAVKGLGPFFNHLLSGETSDENN